MDSNADFTVEVASWDRDQAALGAIREAVFVLEQKVPVDLEWDGIDHECVHVMAYTETRKEIGTGRLLRDGHIGRLAVLRPWRHQGVGALLLLKLMSIAKARGDSPVALNAQTHALAFYERFGFVAAGEEFDEAGIPHQTMVLKEKTG